MGSDLAVAAELPPLDRLSEFLRHLAGLPHRAMLGLCDDRSAGLVSVHEDTETVLRPCSPVLHQEAVYETERAVSSGPLSAAEEDRPRYPEDRGGLHVVGDACRITYDGCKVATVLGRVMSLHSGTLWLTPAYSSAAIPAHAASHAACVPSESCA